jgi:hypothetical protein
MESEKTNVMIYCDVHKGHEKVERCVLRLCCLLTSILERRARSSRQECDSERDSVLSG